MKPMLPALSALPALGGTLLWAALAYPGDAHQVQIQGEVGATMHVEPNDIAIAGADTDVWFALTQKGGAVIPLAACDCSLTVYDAGASPVAAPELSPVSAEGFINIPGAVITFPEVGAYELVLAGTPTGISPQFAPFELSFDVTVAGQANPSAQADEPQTKASPEETQTSALPETSAPEPSSFSIGRFAPWGGVVLVGIILLGLISRLRSPGGTSS